MRVKKDYRTTSKEAYDSFCKRNSSIKLSYYEWTEILYNFNEDFRNYILETGGKERLPSGIGPFSINKKKRKTKKKAPNGKEYINLPVDWVKSKEKGRIIYNFNHHTDGYFFGWMWFKTEARIPHTTLWRFKPSRVSSRMISHYIKTNPQSQHFYKEWKV